MIYTIVPVGTWWNMEHEVWTSGVYTSSGISWDTSGHPPSQTPLPFTYWAAGALISDRPTFNCVYLARNKDRRWDTGLCRIAKSFLCERH